MSDLVTRFVEAQIRGDRHAALAVLREGDAARDHGEHLRLLRDAQREIGQRWERGEITVAQEHVATAIAQFVLAKLSTSMQRGPSLGKRVVLACVEGELHDMGPRIGVDHLELAGFDVRFVGASPTVESLVALVEQERADLVALSLTMPSHAESLRAFVEGLRAAGVCAPIVVGGHALRVAPAIAEGLAVDGVGADAEELVALARRLA